MRSTNSAACNSFCNFDLYQFVSFLIKFTSFCILVFHFSTHAKKAKTKKLFIPVEMFCSCCRHVFVCAQLLPFCCFDDASLFSLAPFLLRLADSRCLNNNLFLWVFLISELRHWRAISLSWIDRNFFRILFMGPANYARHQRPKQDLSRPYLSHERSRDGYQRHFVIPECATYRRAFGCLGSEIFPSHHSVLHMRSHSTDVD